MNYEERYNQALERARYYHDRDNIHFLENIFPELRESEDERIRKEIIQSIQDNMCVIHKDKCLAWLEKQQDIIDLEEYAKGILKSAAIHLMIWIDENLADGKMCLSNMECEDLEDAMVNAKWDKIYKYIKKKIEKQGEQKLAESISQLTIQGKGFYKICPYCKERMVRDESKVYTSIPPQYEYKCPKCGTMEFDTVMYDNPEMEEQISADKVEPKFKIGDWITNGEYNWKVTDIKPLDYILQSQNGDVVDDTISYVDEEFHLWTIEDAKDGDVLFTTCDNTNEMVFIYHGIEFDASNCYFLYSHTRNECKIFNSVCSVKADIRPATKEQCNFLFQKMKEVGYEWDAEKKELKKIYQEYPLTPSECFKPSWSEEDEEMIDFMIEFIESLCWRKDLTQRKDNVLSWLKSIKPNHWKPSEEQMEALKKRTHGLHESSETRKALESLIDDLTKL